MLTKCGSLRPSDRRIERFQYWQERLVILKNAFDESRPSKLSQWWYDRRNGVQWYNYWLLVAGVMLTAMFGLVQSIKGGLQVYKAYHPSEY